MDNITHPKLDKLVENCMIKSYQYKHFKPRNQGDPEEHELLEIKFNDGEILTIRSLVACGNDDDSSELDIE